MSAAGPEPRRAARLLFPTQLQAAPSGYLVGWPARSPPAARSSRARAPLAGVPLVALATVAPASVGLVALDQALALLASDPQAKELVAYCGGAPTVVGVWLRDDEELVLPSSERVQTADMWLSLVGCASYCHGVKAASRGPNTLAPLLPVLRDVRCHGCCCCTTLQIIFYDSNVGAPPHETGSSEMTKSGGTKPQKPAKAGHAR